MSEYIIKLGEADRSMFCEEIVRCRDCKYLSEIIEEYKPGDITTVLYCEHFDETIMSPDGFCKWGEREDNGNS